MSLLVYCILRARGERPPDLPPGIDGAPVQAIEEGEFAAVVSPVAKLPEPRGLAPILEYRAVIEAFAARSAVLPVRYGALFASTEAVRALLHREQERFGAALGEVEGHVEMAVLLALRAPDAEPRSGGAPDSPSPSGRAYLAARREHYARTDEGLQSSRSALERCRKAFEGLFTRYALEGRLQALPSSSPGGKPRQLASVRFLVPGNRVDEFQARFRALAASEEAELALSGPHPPYSFVSVEAGSGGQAKSEPGAAAGSRGRHSGERRNPGSGSGLRLPPE